MFASYVLSINDESHQQHHFRSWTKWAIFGYKWITIYLFEENLDIFFHKRIHCYSALIRVMACCQPVMNKFSKYIGVPRRQEYQIASRFMRNTQCGESHGIYFIWYLGQIRIIGWQIHSLSSTKLNSLLAHGYKINNHLDMVCLINRLRQDRLVVSLESKLTIPLFPTTSINRVATSGKRW